MNTHVCRILTGAALAMVVGLAGAQTYGNQPSAMPDKTMTQDKQAQPASPSGSTMAPSQNEPLNSQAQTSRPSDSTSADTTKRIPANRGVTENTPAQSEPSQLAGKVSGQTAQGEKMSASKPAKSTHHASKARSHEQQAAMKGDKAYQDALRNCAKEQDQSTRDKCLDNAIEQFHRNT
jgi:hypothetical protein